MTESTTIRYERGEDGIVVLTLDDPNQSANTMNAAYVASMGATVDRLEAEKEEIKGVVLTSAKKTFFAGGDLNDLKQVRPEHSAELAEGLKVVKGQLRRLETLGVPVVAAINGAALGGGLEICLATHCRIAVDDSKVKLGFPEVKLGLLPGGGGVVRSVRMFGIADALMKLLMQGKELRPDKALEMGLVDEVVPTVDDLLPAAKAWIEANPEAVQPWDADGYKMPGGTPSSPSLAQNLPAFPANLRKQLKGANYPAPHHIMAAAVEGAQVDFDNAIEIEGRYFVDLATGQVAKNMIQAFFFDLQEVNGTRNRPEEIEPFEPRKMVVLGAGMMGAAIAYVSAKAGIEVVLKDVDLEAAERGKGYSQGLVEKAVSRGRIERGEGRRAAGPDHAHGRSGRRRRRRARDRGRLRGPRGEGQGLRRDRAAPRRGRAAGLQHLDPADHRPRRGGQPPGRVHRPALLQPGGQDAAAGDHQGRADQRGDALPRPRRRQEDPQDPDRGQRLARVLHLAGDRHLHQRGDRDADRGRPGADDRAGLLAGRLPGPGAAALRRAQPQPDAQDPQGDTRTRWKPRATTWADHPSTTVIDRMLDEFDRGGRLAGKGFYEYDEEGKRVGLWKGLPDAFPSVEDPSQISLRDLEERMMFAESLETVKCIDEGVIESVADANIGSIFGIGFPAWSGGVLQYIDGYEGGPAGFVARARELAAQYGERFEPPESLVELAERGETYAERGAALAAA